MQRTVVMMFALLALTSNAVAARPKPKPTPSPTVAPSATPSPSPEPTAAPTASPTPAPSPSPGHVSSSLPIDGAFSLPSGVWTCETLGNSTATSAYRLIDRNHIAERTLLHLANRPPVELDTAFAFDMVHKVWHLSMQKGAYVATAPVWSGDTWIFEGVEADAQPRRNVRLVYTSLGADAYRSDYQSQVRGAWQTFSGATCKRVQP